MKHSLQNITLILALALLTTTGFAAPNPYNSESIKTYNFKYKYNNETYEIRKPANSYEEAFDHASSECFKHFKGNQPVSEDKGLDIIDVCANPRS